MFIEEHLTYFNKSIEEEEKIVPRRENMFRKTKNLRMLCFMFLYCVERKRRRRSSYTLMTWRRWREEKAKNISSWKSLDEMMWNVKDAKMPATYTHNGCEDDDDEA